MELELTFEEASKLYDIAVNRRTGCMDNDDESGRVLWSGQMLMALQRMNLLTGKKVTKKLREVTNDPNHRR